jgi:hypothetical protein
MPFKKGESGNPAGRTPGYRNRFTEAFWKDFCQSWVDGGAEALTKVRTDDPSTFVRVAAALMPKETTVTLKNELDQMTDAELREFIRSELAAGGGSGDQASQSPNPSQLN